MDMEAAVLAGLLKRGMAPHVAQGVVANMIAESGLKPGINEIAPLVPGSRGGFGLNQWTGPRRVAFEGFAKGRGAGLDDLDTQLDFTMHELQGPESRAWAALQGAPDAVTAARVYSEKFLRPGIPNMDKRLREAARLSGQPMPDPSMFSAAGGPPAQSPGADGLAGLFGGEAPMPNFAPQRRSAQADHEDQTRKRRQAFFGSGGLADVYG
jgi:hypothetical protein